MIKDKNTTIGYHCPQCGISILNTLNMFSFSTGSGNLVKLKCPCGASELVINITKDKKFRISVPCIVCPNSHSYAISPHIFFGRELFAFSCKFTALNICFTGKSQNVVDAMRQNEQELLETFAEYDDTFDPDMKELTDIFTWDDEDYDDDWFEDFEKMLESEEGLEETLTAVAKDLDKLGNFGDFNKMMAMETSGYELYKNENFDSDLSDSADSSDSNKREKADLSNYSAFSVYSTDIPAKPERDGSKNKKKAIKIDDDTDASTIKLTHYQIVMQIMDTLARLLKDKKVHCKCGNFEGSISFLEDYVTIQCKRCGAGRNIKSANVSDIEYISDMGELFLDFED
jgi:hypothetical protein